MTKYIFTFLLLLPIFLKAQIITTFAGGGSIGLGDGGPATSAQLGDPTQGFFDRLNNMYFATAVGGNRIRKIDNVGIITTVAGTGVSGFGGDNGPATMAKLSLPTCVTEDRFGNLFIVDGQNNRIRKVDLLTGIITTVVGNGTAGFSGDNGAATAASLFGPGDACFDTIGNLYIADYSNGRIRKVGIDGRISTFAGNGLVGYSGDGCKADTSRIGGISGVCADIFGNVFLADISLSRVFKVDRMGIITTVAGTGIGHLFNGDGIPATNANINPTKIAVDKFGNLFIAEHLNYRVRRVSPQGYIYTVAGIGVSGFGGDGGNATAAQLSYPSGIMLDSCGNLYISEANNNRIRKVTYPKCNYLDVPDVLNEANMQVYPNPTVDALHIDGLQTAMQYRLIDVAGREWQHGALRAGNNEVPVPSLTPGLYLLELTDEQGYRTVHRIVKE